MSQEVEHDLSVEPEEDIIDETRGPVMTAIVGKVLVEPIFDVEPAELIAGSDINAVTYEVVLRTQGSYKRGELLMMSGNQFVKATADGIASAAKLAVLADSETVGEDEYAEVVAYTSGRFFGSKIILPYETESDDHETLLAGIKDKLMQQSIYLS